MMILLYFYKSQKTLKLQGEIAFWNSFCMTMLCILFDILSCIAIVFSHYLPEMVVKFFCKIYIGSVVCVAFCALLYIFSDIYTSRNAYRNAILKYAAMAAAGLVVILATPISFVYNPENNTLYSYGVSCYCAYAFAALTIAVILIRLHVDKAKINKGKRGAVYIWLGIWIAALAIQFFFKQLLLASFASSLAMLVLYLRLENPGNNLDRQTGLFNNSAFLQYAKQLYDSDIRFSLLSILLDRNAFKSMRADIEAQVMGEAVKYLSSLPNVYVFRNSTNEVFLVFPDIEKNAEGIAAVRERFEKGWGENGGVIVSPHWIFVADSGIATDVDDLMFLMQYVRRESKEFQESQFFEVTKELAQKLHRENDIGELIISAIANDRVEIWYQPIFSTEDHRFTSAEALVRIRDTEGNLIPPGSFIEIAERNGMIMQLGELVFRRVCRFLKDTDITDYGIKYIEVNLSVVQCAYKDLADEYIAIMKEADVPASSINLEITESASMSAKKTLLKNMETLMNYGVTFSLDDFGTGQSNLDYIVDMPVHIVKFDKNMTNAYFENGKAKYIMDAAMNMIRGMDLKIVSEGIETREQFFTMENLGINFIQGYYFSKPLPEAEFLEFIKRENKAS